MANGPALVFGQLTFPLNKEINSVGRKDRITNLVPDVDLGALDQERSVSRKHAELVYDHGTIALRDVGSTNGTSVNGEGLAHQVDRPLRDGDEVGFGGVTMAFAAAAEWPQGIEAQWPPEPEPALEETMISSPEETMVAGPMATEETMVAPPQMAEETMVAPPPDVKPEAVLPQPPVEAPVYVACSNHPHLPAIGLCPGCLEAFCVDCLPEREDGLMVCARCAGISYRLGATTGPDQAAAPSPVPVAAGDAAPAASAPASEAEKKKWPF